MADLSVLQRGKHCGRTPPLDTPTFGAVLVVCGQASRAAEAVKSIAGTRVQLLEFPSQEQIPVSTQGIPYSLSLQGSDLLPF